MDLFSNNTTKAPWIKSIIVHTSISWYKKRFWTYVHNIMFEYVKFFALYKY